MRQFRLQCFSEPIAIALLPYTHRVGFSIGLLRSAQGYRADSSTQQRIRHLIGLERKSYPLVLSQHLVDRIRQPSERAAAFWGAGVLASHSHSDAVPRSHHPHQMTHHIRVLCPTVEGKTTAGPQQRVPVSQGCGHVAHIRQGVAANHQIEAARRVIQMFGICLFEFEVAQTCG